MLVPELPAVLLFAFVSSALLVAWRVWCLYRNVESKDKSLQLPLLSGSRSPPRIRSHPGSIYKTYAAPASYRQLAVAVVCCIALWVLVEFSFNILLTKNQDMQPNPSPSSNRDLKFHSALPSQVYAGQKVCASVGRVRTEIGKHTTTPAGLRSADGLVAMTGDPGVLAWKK